jgi:hypothetical protein
VVRALEKPARETAPGRRSRELGYRILRVFASGAGKPAGQRVLNLSQRKIMQETITLAVFVPFAVLYMKQPIKLDSLWAGVCLLGAVYFMFRA